MPQSKRTPETEAKVLAALRAGHSRRVAAGAAGIAQRTLEEWVTDPEFDQRVFEAEAEAERFHAANVNSAASSGIWTASAWWLERRRPAEYARVDRTIALMHIEARELAEELQKDGIDITEAEILRDYKSMSNGIPALPAPKGKKRK
jgi:hypothetical protein